MKRKISYLLVLTMLFSMVTFSNVATAANYELPNQKAYVEIPLDEVSDTDQKVEFLFNTSAASLQKINVYTMDNEFDDTITWDTAPNNNKTGHGFTADKAGSVVATQAGEHSVDVTDVVKAKKAAGKQKLTFALSGQTNQALTTDFTDFTLAGTSSSINVAYGTTGAYISGGGVSSGATASITVSTDYDHTAGFGKSLRIYKSNGASSSRRYKLYNGLKSDGMLTADDIGKQYEVKFWAYNANTAAKSNLQVGFMSAAGGAGTAENPTGSASAFVGNTKYVRIFETDGWVEQTFTYTVTEDTVNKQAGMFTFGDGFVDMYIDDLSIREISPEVNIIASDKIYAPNFDTMESDAYVAATEGGIYSASQYAYRAGGSGGAKPVVSNEANYPSGTGKSLKVLNAGAGTQAGRLKIANAIKTSALTADDIGRTFTISAYLKLSSEAEPSAGYAWIQLGMMSYGGTNYVGTSTGGRVYKDSWNKLTLTRTITEADVTAQAGMPTFVNNQAKDYYYIDNLTVTEIVEDESVLKAPKIKITKSDGTVEYGPCSLVACIEDGENTYATVDSSVIRINDKGYVETRHDLQTLADAWTGTFAAGQSYGHKKSLRNNTDEPVNAILITALYDGDDNLVVADAHSGSIAVGQTSIFETDFTIPGNITSLDDYYAKTMFWDVDNMAPLGEIQAYPDYYDPKEVIVKVSAPEEGKEYGSFYVYVKGTKKSSNMYTQYNFMYVENTATDMYRVKEAYKAQRTGEFSFTRGIKLLQEGEIEMAIKEKKSSYNGNVTPGDFVGGFHADEFLTDVFVKVDGQEISLSEAGNYKGKNVQVYQESNVYGWEDYDDLLIEHVKDYTITKDGIDLNQTAEWKRNAVIDEAFLTMFTIMRTGSETAPRITDYIQFYWSDGTKYNTEMQDHPQGYYDLTNYGYAKYVETIEEKGQVAGEDFSGYAYVPEKIDTKGDGTYINKAHLWSEAGDIDAYVWTETVRGLHNSYANLSARVYGDNKIYFGSHNGETVTSGEIWEVNNHYDIKINN